MFSLWFGLENWAGDSGSRIGIAGHSWALLGLGDERVQYSTWKIHGTRWAVWTGSLWIHGIGSKNRKLGLARLETHWEDFGGERIIIDQ